MIGTATASVGIATCVGTCDMTVALDKTACCTDTACSGTQFKVAAGATACIDLAVSSACTTGVFAAGSTTADSTCTTWAHPTANDCAAGSDWTTGSVTADSTCTACAAGTSSLVAAADCTAW